MKKLLFSVPIFLMLLGGCASFEIPYSGNLKKSHEAILYIPTLPAPIVEVAGIFYADQREKIRINIETLDVRSLIANEFKNISKNSHKRITPIITKEYIENLKIPVNSNYAEEFKSNPRVSDLKFDKLDNIDNKYILNFAIKKYGYNGKGYGKRFYIEALASVHDAKKGTIVWRHYERKSKVMSLTDKTAEKKENVKKAIIDCLNPMIKSCFKNLNK